MNPKRRELLALSNALAVGLLASGTGSSTVPGTSGAETTASTTDDGTATEPPQTATERVVAGNTEFAFDLLDQLAERSPNANLFCSPYSVSVTLAMAYAGAREQTRRQMRETLHFPREDVPAGFRRVQDHLAQYEAPQTTATPRGETADTTQPGETADTTQPGETADTTQPGETPDTTTAANREPTPFQLSAANAIWGQSGFPFLESFLQTLERNYGAGLREVDFESSPEQARKTINEWVADQTSDEITDLLSPSTITAMTRLVLTNAVYFRANWAREFQPDDTEDGTFTPLDGTESTVPLMSQTGTFRYAAVDGHQVVALPYAGGDASMVVLLPAEGEFEAFQQSLSASRLRELFGAMESRRGTVTLPRFTYRSKFQLAKVLAAMGMPSAFDQDANLTGMASGEAGESLSIDEVIHESYVSVDEHGTEAAAATATAVVIAEPPTSTPVEPFEMTVDRPFLFLIRDDETGLVVFLGRVTDAGAAQDDD